MPQPACMPLIGAFKLAATLEQQCARYAHRAAGELPAVAIPQLGAPH